jgi:hypothetical protein
VLRELLCLAQQGLRDFLRAFCFLAAPEIELGGNGVKLILTGFVSGLGFESHLRSPVDGLNRIRS